MGKAARNERIKLRAVFWNNVSVGFLLAGMVVPLLSLFSSEWMFSERFWPENLDKVFVGFAAIITAIIIAIAVHLRALKTLDELED